MRYYEIKIDEKVWEYLKKNAEPFEDTPNTVLNRLLFATENRNELQVIEKKPLNLKVGIPKALSQILEVIYEIRINGRTRTEATNIVAQKNDTATQTVIDKYTRQLGKKAFQIDMLLGEKNLHVFKSLLTNKFLNFHNFIDDFFVKLEKPENVDHDDYKGTMAIEEGKMFSVKEISLIELGKDTRPKKLYIEGEIFQVSNWTELQIAFVNWLISNNKLTRDRLPIFSYSSREEKFFINTEPKHRFSDKDAKWEQVGPFFVDTKYNASAHFRNIVSTLTTLNLNNIDLRIAFAK